MPTDTAIAVIERDDARREEIVETLRSCGLVTRGYGSVEEVLDLKSGLILLCVDSPQSLPLRIRTLRNNQATSTLPLIVMSQREQIRMAFSNGADDFVERDVSSAELSARIQARRSLPVPACWVDVQGEQRSVETLERYVDFFDSSPDGILVISKDGTVLFCNPTACEITGYPAEELLARSIEGMLPRDGLVRFEQLRETFASDEFPQGVDLPIRTKRHQRKVLNVSFNSVHQDTGIIVSFRDVTADRAMARELTKTKEFLQRVIDSSVDAVVSADMKGNVLLFNPAAERTYGYSAEDVVGKINVRDLYPPGVAHRIMKLIRSPQHGGRGRLEGYRTELRGADGPIPVLLAAALIIHRKRAIGSVGVFKDLRDSLNIEAQLKKTTAELAIQEKKALIAELAGAAAHELNQPLTAVMGYADLMSRQLDGPQKVVKASEAIIRETSRMAEIVRKIGKLTKYETKTYVGDSKILDLDRSVDSDPYPVAR